MGQILTFNVAREWYGLDIAQVEAVEPEEDITPVPGAPAHILGVTDWRGKLVAAVDLRSILGLEERPLGRRGFLVVTKNRWQGAALVVDGVDEIAEVDPASADPPLSTLSPTVARCVTGEVKLGDKLVVLLDLEALVEVASGGDH